MNDDSRQPRPASASPPESERLSSWKSIAAHFDISVRTVQRWERVEGLPVRRHEHASQGTVYAWRSELDEWLAGRLEQELRPEAAAQSTHLEQAASRLIVLPFRLLRPDPEIEFLTFSLADAITASLMGVNGLVIRSPLVAARWSGGTDLMQIARMADVDRLLVGTLLRSGEEIRASTQLVDGATGTVISSQVAKGSLGDIFRVQEQIAREVMSSLALPLSRHEREILGRDVPNSPAAYEHYLRANEIAATYPRVSEACDLYERSVEEDPQYAPAWARLGRCRRVVAKFRSDPKSFGRAEEALSRALELNPDLAVAHTQLAYLEADSSRAEDAMARLLLQARTTSSDPELFAGLVHVCRFCGLLDASVAAHERARRLDPLVRSSVCHSYFMRGTYDRALETSNEIRDFVGPLALAAMGRKQEALALAREHRPISSLPLGECMISSVRLFLEGDRSAALTTCEQAIALITQGPEELYYLARLLCQLSELDRAVAVFGRAVDQGFFCYPAFACDPWLDPLRKHQDFENILNSALKRHTNAVRAFVAAGGERTLGMSSFQQ